LAWLQSKIQMLPTLPEFVRTLILAMHKFWLGTVVTNVGWAWHNGSRLGPVGVLDSN